MARDSHVFPRHCHSDLPTVAAGDGIFLIDTDGERDLDGANGAGGACLGHSDGHGKGASQGQGEQSALCHTGVLN
ncbi:MAG: aspartate aminotransferase family protein, partial [Arenibacterium sp.]